VVRVAADAPVTVVGSGFREHEAVSVTVLMGTRRFDGAVVGSATGEFSVRFSGTRLVVSARGELTGLVTATLPPRECAAP
jgi:hypothetical protein